MKNFPKNLIAAYKRFISEDFPEQEGHYKNLAEYGQNPKVMVIACCDSRVDVNNIFSFGTGELFVVRNIANLVPPYETEGRHHGVSAAIEYAALGLRVEHIVVLGHSRCGGIQAALNPQPSDGSEINFVANWMSILDGPKAKTEEKCALCSSDEKQFELEKDGVIHSLENLRTFPFIKELEEQGRLGIHGSHFDIETGDLKVYDQAKNLFVSIK